MTKGLTPRPNSTIGQRQEKAPEDLSRVLTSTTLCCLGSKTSHEVQIANDATKWLLCLCDGRSLVLLVVCPCGSGILHSENEVGQAMVAMEGGSTLECSERWCDDDSVVDFLIKDLCLVTGVEGDQNIGLGEQSLMWVEPIAVFYPLGRGKEDEKGFEKGESASWQ
ncbi:hypothetical protein FCV25MIE_28655 [Fagus crenata]